jgi:hypothetical protein
MSKLHRDDLEDATEDDTEDVEGEEICECYQCAFGPQAMQALIEQGIRDVGWIAIPIADGEPFAFCYTVGLKETFGHPEFIMQGNFDPRQMAQIIGEAVEKLREEPDAFQAQEVPGVIKVRVHGVIQDGMIGCRDVTRENRLGLLCRAGSRYGDDDFEAKQLIFPDQHALLPWQPGFNEEWGAQQATLYELYE